LTSITFKNKPALLIIQRHFTAGGASNYTQLLIKHLREVYRVHVWVLGKADRACIDALGPDVAVQHWPLKHDAHRGHHRYWQFTPKLQDLQDKLMRQQGFDVVLGICLFPGSLAALLFNQVPAPLKYLFMLDEALLDFDEFSPQLQDLIQLSCAQSTALVSVSEDLIAATQQAIPTARRCPSLVLAPLLREDFLKEAQAIKNSPSAPMMARPWRLFTAARLVAGKNILRCLEIHLELKRRGISCVWQIAGEGPQRSILQKTIRAYGLDDEFILLGQREDMVNLFSQADVFVLLSESEGCPTVIIEAIACACPVVTTPVHGVKRYIEDGQNGYIVGFDKQEQVDRLHRLLDNQTELRAMKNKLRTQAPIHQNDLPLFMNELQSHISQTSKAKPRVLIAIPTFNQAHYLDEAISSALMQTYDELEVYVLDDCSTDHTSEQVKKWLSDPRCHYIRHSKNIGRCANYRYAVNQLPDSDWMMILDGDDYYTDARFIQDAIALATQRESIVFVQAGHTPYQQASASVGPATLPQINNDHQCVTGLAYIQHWFATGFFTHLGILFKRSVARTCDMYQANISSSDMESFLRLARCGSVILMKRSVGHWRQHDDNASRQLHPEEVAPNVQIFRCITNQWIAEGLAELSDFEPTLTRYQARTYAYLYQQAVRRSEHPNHPWDLVRSIWDVHPRLFTQRKIIKLIFKATWWYVSQKR